MGNNPYHLQEGSEEDEAFSKEVRWACGWDFILCKFVNYLITEEDQSGNEIGVAN